jgi:Zn-dependent protease with chaperone function
MFLWGLWLLLLALYYPVMFVPAFLALMIAWHVRPRRVKMPPLVLVPEQAPALYALVARLVTHLGSAPVTDVAVNLTFSAGIMEHGWWWRRRRVVVLGLPLAVLLSAQERVALLTHELAHGRHNDILRTALITSALRSLSALEEAFIDRVVLPATVLTLPVRIVAALLGFGLQCLICGEWQRAEYRADAVAAQVAGIEAMQGLFTTILYDELAFRALHDAAATATLHIGDPLAHLRRVFAALPATEQERQRRREAGQPALLGATHPPAALRRDALQRLASVTPRNALPSIVLSPAEDAIVSAELDHLFRQLWSYYRRLYDWR